MNRQAKVVIFLSCVIVLSLFNLPVLGAEVELQVGSVAGNVPFSAVTSAEDQKYLGLGNPGAFTLKDIKAPYVLAEVFSTTCPHCMQQAPVLNNLYNLVQKDAKMKDQLKLVSVGQGNDDTAVKMWKVFHKVPFPVLSDPDQKLGKALKIPGTPVTVVLDKKGKVVWAHIGAFESADEALKGIKAALK
jgi:peroxiredoxin